jgi:hypothetical protein
MRNRPVISDQKVSDALRECAGDMTAAAKQCGYKGFNTFMKRVNKTPELRRAASEGAAALLDIAIRNLREALESKDEERRDKATYFALKELGWMRGLSEPKSGIPVFNDTGGGARDLSEAELVAIVRQSSVTVLRKGDGRIRKVPQDDGPSDVIDVEDDE